MQQNKNQKEPSQASSIEAILEAVERGFLIRIKDNSEFRHENYNDRQARQRIEFFEKAIIRFRKDLQDAEQLLALVRENPHGRICWTEIGPQWGNNRSLVEFLL